jgi:hypothetical protein
LLKPNVGGFVSRNFSHSSCQAGTELLTLKVTHVVLDRDYPTAQVKRRLIFHIKYAFHKILVLLLQVLVINLSHKNNKKLAIATAMHL